MKQLRRTPEWYFIVMITVLIVGVLHIGAFSNKLEQDAPSESCKAQSAEAGQRSPEQSVSE